MNLHPVHHGLRRKMLAVLVAACYTSASANPTAPQVIAGQASFQQSGNLFSITNTPNAIINWQSFSIAPHEVTRFIQQNADSRVLNRITGQDPSRILGALQSNGHVYLINPNGVLFGKDARIDVQGLVASSLALSDNDFLAGRNRFTGVNAGKVSNEGAIVTPNGGKVFLVGSSVENSGVITSPQGDVVLAAGHTVQLVDSSDPSVHVVVSAPEDQALNLGQVLASGGRVGIYGALVNQRGKVSADSAVRGENGKIVLKSSGTTLLEKGSVTSAVNTAGQGGDIKLLGQRVGLTGDAQADASGEKGGGQILIGGGQQGQDPSVPHAQQTYIGEQVQVRSNALGSGNGGRVIAWGDNATRVYGSLSARGGAQGGDGGFVETSGGYLDMRGAADTRAPLGKIGQMLLDPTNITIIGGSPSNSSNVQVTNDTVFAEVGSSTDSELETGRLVSLLGSTNMTVSTASSAGAAGNLTVSSDVGTSFTWSSSNKLTLRADNNIAINGAISASNAPIELNAIGGSITQSTAITAASVTASAPAGSITLNHTGNAISGAVSASASGNILLSAQTLTTGTVAASGSGSIIQASSAYGALTIGGNMSSNGGAILLQSNYLNGIVTGSSTAISSGGGVITLQGDNMDLQGTINAGSGGISATARSTSQAVHLGGTEADSTNILALTEAEIQRLSTTGAITLTNAGTTGGPDIEVNALNVASSHPTGAFNIVAQGDSDVIVQGNVSANGILVVTSGNTNTSHITLDGTLTSASSVVLSTGFLTANQNITAPTIGLVSKNSIDVGATNETVGVLNIPTASLPRFNTTSLLLQVDDSVSTGDITFSQPFSWTGSLFLNAQDQYSTGSNSFTVTGQLALENGKWVQNSATLPTLSVARLKLTSAGFTRVTGGDGSSGSPYQITDVYGLQGVGSVNATDHYIVANNIDASSTSTWNNSSGFAPLGSSVDYAGIFDGNNKTISGLTINRATTDGVGLFGYLGAGTVKNLTLSGGSITGKDMTGAVVGQVTSGSGVISGVASSTPVSGVFAVGGLAGMNSGTVSASSSSGTVTASGSSGVAKAGGLVGYNTGAITKSFATGAVSSTVEAVGGLAGYSSGPISKSYASGSVSGGRSVGGIVGYNTANVSDSYATGSVTGTTGGAVTNAQVGGIAGYSSGGAISTSFTTSAISASGFSDVHGAIGVNATATSTNNYWNTTTAGSGVTETLATGLTSTQMAQQGSFTGFDFTNTWQLGATNPVLRDFLVPLTITLTGGTTSKTYDGTAQTFNPSVSYSGFTGGDTSSSLGGTLGWGTSGALNAGTYTPSGLSSNKYSITYTGASSSLTISQRPVTAVFSGSKVYDGTTSLASPTFTISNVITSDTSNLTLDGSVLFADKNVGTSKPLSASVTLAGSAAPNYTLSSTSGTGTITAAPLTISGLSGVNRVYDGSATATLNTGSATLCCKATGDAVTVSYTPGFTTFANKNVGTGKVITIGSSAFTLSGSDAGNYTMTPPTGITADITPAALTVTGLSGVSRVYNATTTAGVTGTPVLSGKLGSDVVSVASYSDGTFADKNVGTGKGITLPSSAFTLTGADAGNYSVTAPTGLSANVTAAPLTVSGVTAVSRTYDATTVASLTGTPVLSGVFTVASVTDDVSASPTLGNGSFADKAVGTGKAVTAPGSVITLTGADAGNYTVSSLSGLTADISKAPLTVSGLTASSRAYNQLTSASTSGGSLVGLFGSDTVTMGSVTADFDTKDAGTGKTVTVSNVAISGTDAGNYSVTMPTGLTANITPAILTVSGMTANSRVYDATTAASTTGGALAGILGSEDVALGTATASFADKNVGTGKPVAVSAIALTGADAGNYTVTAPTGLTAAITPASLTVTGITGVSRAYNGGTSVNLSGSPLLAGVLGSDTVTLNSSLGTGTFADKHVGTAKAITIPGGALSITGTDAANYTLTIPTGVTADITAAGLTLTGLSATSRTYNGGTSVATTGGSLLGVIEGELVSMGTVTADFADKHVGTAKPVTVSQVALTGADAGNYTVTPPSGLTANVTPAPLTVSGIAGLTRVYDGSTSANTSGGTLSGIFSGDDVAIGAVSASFGSKNVGTLKPVTVASVSLTGADATNYTVTVPTGLTAAITPATLTITGMTGVSREYNNTTAATTTGGTLAGVIGSDVVSAGTFTATFADKHVGTAKPLTLTTIGLLGTDAANYTLTQPTGITADITQRPLSTWIGGADNFWTNSNNWAGGIAPDAANVAAAVLPLASGDVVLPSGSTVTLETLTASGGQKVVIDGGTLTLGTNSGHASNIAAMGINSGGVNVVGTLSGTNYVQVGGALGGSGGVTFSSFAQGGGTVSGLASLAVTNNWAQSGGTFSIPGTLSIQQNTGSLVMKATTAQTSITLDVTEGGSISQNGPLITNALSTNSQNGVTLTNTGNQIKAYSGTNSTSGGISLVNTTGSNVLALGPVTSTNGGITVDNTGSGGIHVSGALSAPTGAVSLTAHSPINVTSSITADSIALDASTNVSLGSGSTLSAVHNITIDAGTGIGLDGTISSTSGSVAMVADTGNIVAGSGASITSPGGVSLTTVTGSVTAASTIFSSGTTPTINDAAAVAAAKAAADAAAAQAAAEAAAKKAAEEAAAKAAAEAAAKKAAEEAAAKAAAEAAAKKAAEEAAAKAAAEAAAKKAAEEAAAKAAAEAAAKAAAEAAAKKAAEEAAAKAAAEAAAKAAEEAAAKAAAEAAGKAAAEAAAKAAEEAAAKAAAEAAAKAAAEAAAKAAEEAAAKAAAEAAAKAAQEAAAKAAAEAAAKKAAEEAAAKAAAEAAAKAAAEAAAKKAAEEAAAKAAAEAAAKAQQTKEAEPVREAINTAVNLINTAANNVVDTTPAATPASAGSGGSSSSSASSSASSDSKSDSDSKKEEKKDGVAPQDSAPKKDEPIKKMYCN